MNRIDRPFTDDESAIRTPIYSPRRGLFSIPEPSILDAPVYCFKVNAEWVGHIIGMFMALDQPDAWTGTALEIDDARNEIRKLIASIDICEEPSMKPCMPIGTVFTAVVDSIEGCLLCDGQFYLAEDYPDLFDVLPDVYKDETIFYVPQMQGRVAVGATPGSGDIPALEVGDTGGEWKHALGPLENAAHTHTIAIRHSGALNQNDRASAQNTAGTGVVSGNATTATQGTGAAHNNAQPYLALNYFIVAIPDCGDQMAEKLRFRQNPTDNCLLEYSINEGSNWSTAFNYSLCTPMELNQILTNQTEAERLLRQILDQYDGTPGSIAPDSEYGDADDAFRDAAQCYVLRLLIQSTLDSIAEDKENSDKLKQIFGTILSLAAVGLVYFTGGLSLIWASAIAGTIVTIQASKIANISEVELRDEDAREEIVCCAMNNLRGQTPTLALFQSAFTGCSGLSTTAEKQRDIMNDLVQGLDVYLAYLSAVQEAFSLAERGIITDDCCGSPTQLIVPSTNSTGTNIAVTNGLDYEISWAGTVQIDDTSPVDISDGIWRKPPSLAWSYQSGIQLQYSFNGSTFSSFPMVARSDTGYAFIVTATSNTLYMRFLDTVYTDNAGSFTVNIIGA